MFRENHLCSKYVLVIHILQKKEKIMSCRPNLVDEIMAAVKETPLEFQEHILDIVKAMTLQKKVSVKNDSGDAGKYQ